MMRLATWALALGVLPVSAMADPVELICENWRREYLVTADVTARTVFANDTRYSVLAIEQGPSETTIVGTTVNDGPTFKLTLGDHPKIEMFADSKLIQVDICRNADVS